MLKKSFLPEFLPKLPLLLLLGSGGFFALKSLLFGSSNYPNIAPAAFLDTLPVTLEWVNLGALSFPIQVDNYLVFQEFRSIAPAFTIVESHLFAGITFLLMVSMLSILSTFRKIPFLGAGAGWIILLTLLNSNGLNISSINSNLPLILLIIGTLSPLIFFHVWKPGAGFGLRWMSIFATSALTVGALIYLSPVDQPSLYLAEQSLILSLAMALAWFFWQGHAVVSGIYLLLARANYNLGIKISRQFLVLAGLYLLTLIFNILALKGEVSLPFPTFSALFLILPIGLLGWISTQEKLLQSEELATDPRYLKALFLLGLSAACWLFWKLEFSGNQPAEEFLKHLIVYSQFGFSLFFLVYVLSNFLSVMDTGKSVDKILYKPYSLPYYHLRIGGMITMLVITIYMDAVLAPQFNSLTTNILGDYYYQTGKKLQASILYENAWASYRKNPKAKNATAHLLFDLKQPTLAKDHLNESFSEAPQVDNILLLSSRLILENKPIEAIFYLENGLKQFPDNPLLVNNLALVYISTMRSPEAFDLLSENKQNDPVIQANRIALQGKLRKNEAGIAPGKDLITQINTLALSNYLGQLKTPEELQTLKQDLEKESSMMLLQAGSRNLFSVKNIVSTSEDLGWIDSFGKKEGMLDYLMQVQETASIRSLAAGRVSEAVKNLNGLAFRNPGDAGYYLNLTAGILAQNLDFQKASKDLIAAEEKGFADFRPFHLTVLQLGGFEEKAAEFRTKYQIQESADPDEFLLMLAKFNESIPQKLYEQWEKVGNAEWKVTMAVLLLERKGHGLNSFQLNQLGNSLKGKVENEEKLTEFLQNPDWSNQASLIAFMDFIQAGEELSANPYRTPLLLSAAERLADPVAQYELLNSASEFSRDPLLWIRKVEAARRIGLDNYATAALQEMNTWLTWDEIELLQGANY